MTTRAFHSLLPAAAALIASLAGAAESEGLPPPAPGREVVIDSKVMTTQPGERSLKLSDLDPETADLVREINSKPGTWQIYLLYTAEDLPERMFHPGFAIRLPGKRRPAMPEVQAEPLPDRARETKPPPAAAPPPPRPEGANPPR